MSAPAGPSSIERLVLVTSRVLLAAVAMGSLLGIWVVVAGTGGTLVPKLLWTAMLATGACLLILASTERWERAGGRAYAKLGVTASGLGCTVRAVLVWAEAYDSTVSRVSVGLVFLGVLGAHGASVCRTSLPARGTWTRWPALACVALLTVVAIYALFVRTPSVHLKQTLLVLAILAVATTLLVATFQRLAR